MALKLTKSSIFIMLAVLVTTGTADAFNAAITYHQKSRAGTVKNVRMAGTYALNWDEKALTDVRIITFDQNGRRMSEAKGNWNASTWSVGVGDFALFSYYVQFKVSLKASSSYRYYRTNTFVW